MNNTLTYGGYTAEINYSADDEVFFGKVAGVNDLVLFEETSLAGSKRAFKEAIADYLDTLKSLKKDTSSPR